jgi:hypothetical protein
LKKETNHTSKAPKYDLKSTRPDDERFYVSMPTQKYGEKKLEKDKNRVVKALQ